MLDLDAGAHLDEEELVGLGVHQKLDRSGAAVSHPSHSRRAASHSCSRSSPGRPGAGVFLDHLLTAPLERAVALAEIDAALAVAQHLHLHVPGLRDEALDVQPVVVEGGLGLASGGGEAAAQLVLVARDADAAPASAAGRLERDREADLLGHRRGLLHRPPARPIPGSSARRPHGDLPRAGLVAHEVDVVAVGPTNEGPPPRPPWRTSRARRGTRSPDGPPPRPCRVRAHDGLDVQIAARRGRRADLHRAVGEAHVARAGVRVAVDRHRLEAEVVRRAHDPERDLATIGDEDGPHGSSSTTATGWPAITDSSLSTSCSTRSRRPRSRPAGSSS